jgi:hypothetical protein
VDTTAQLNLIKLMGVSGFEFFGVIIACVVIGLVMISLVTATISKFTVSTSNVALKLTSTGILQVIDSTGTVINVSDCNKLTAGPYPNKCIKQWWGTSGGAGCTTDPTTSTTLMNKWNSTTAVMTPTQIKADMQLIATTKDDTNAMVCYNQTSVDHYKTNILNSGMSLDTTQSLINGTYTAKILSTGALVVMNGTTQVWTSGTSGTYNKIIMQADGNLVLAKPDNTTIVISNTAGNNGAQLVLTNTGKLNVVSTSNVLLWSSDCDSTTAPYPIGCIRKWWGAAGAGCVTDPATLTAKLTQWNTMTPAQVKADMQLIASTQDDTNANMCYNLNARLKYHQDTLLVGDSLNKGDYLCSGSYIAVMSNNGNLEIYNKPSTLTDCTQTLPSSLGKLLWTTNVPGSTAVKAIIKSDASVALQDSAGVDIWTFNSYTAPNILLPGATLTTGQVLINNGFTAIMQTDGNFVIYDINNSPVTASGTSGSNLIVKMRTDGNLVINTAANIDSTTVAPLWQSYTNSTANANSVLSFNANGELEIINTSGYTIWSTKPITSLLAGGYITTMQRFKNGTYMAYIQSDGKLIQFNNTTPEWNNNVTGTSRGNYVLYMKTDGTFAIATTLNSTSPIWTGGIAGNANARLDFTASGALAVMTSDNRMVWTSKIISSGFPSAAFNITRDDTNAKCVVYGSNSGTGYTTNFYNDVCMAQSLAGLDGHSTAYVWSNNTIRPSANPTSCLTASGALDGSNAASLTTSACNPNDPRQQFTYGTDKSIKLSYYPNYCIDSYSNTNNAVSYLSNICSSTNTNQRFNLPAATS